MSNARPTPEQRQIIRQKQNREAAKNSRKKKAEVLTALKQKSAELEHQVDEVTAWNSHLISQAKELQDKCARLERSITDVSSSNAELQLNVQAHEEKCASLQQIIDLHLNHVKEQDDHIKLLLDNITTDAKKTVMQILASQSSKSSTALMTQIMLTIPPPALKEESNDPNIYYNEDGSVVDLNLYESSSPKPFSGVNDSCSATSIDGGHASLCPPYLRQ